MYRSSGRFFVEFEDRAGVLRAGMLDQRQTHYDKWVVIGGDAADAFGVASETAVDDHLLAVPARAKSDRLHQRPALAEAIAGMSEIDMSRMQAERAVIAMPPARNGRTDECAAMPALEGLAPLHHLSHVVMRRRLATALRRFIMRSRARRSAFGQVVIVRNGCFE